METIIEPFRIKSVEPIKMTTRQQRQQLIESVGYNLFSLKSEDVLIDLLTDSGTGAMSSEQWAALQRGDESYAGAPSYFRFKESVQELMPFKHILPTHQGRAAEKILASLVGGNGVVIPNNTHFDTTRANIEHTGAMAVDLRIAQATDMHSDYPFKGNMDVDKLEALLAESAENIPIVMVTVTSRFRWPILKLFGVYVTGIINRYLLMHVDFRKMRILLKPESQVIKVIPLNKLFKKCFHMLMV